MLSVRWLSGKELAQVPRLDELGDVKGLKRHLHQLRGLPPRFRQRILLHGQILDDATKLELLMELELILLSYCAGPKPDELISAGLRGSVAEVRI